MKTKDDDDDNNNNNNNNTDRSMLCRLINRKRILDALMRIYMNVYADL